MHPAVADEVARVVYGEEILASRQRRRVGATKRRLGRIVERIARLLVPLQTIGSQRLAVGYCGRLVETPVGIDRQAAPVAAHDDQGRLDPP